MNERHRLLERYGRVYGQLGLAIAFTETIDPAKGDPKAASKGWNKTKPLASGDYGAALVGGRGIGRNPVVVLRASNLIGIDADTPERLEQLRELGLPGTVTVRSSEAWKLHFWFRPPNGGCQYAAFRFEGELGADRNRYLLVPPALHPSGAVYTFVRSPEDTEIATLPAELYDELVRLCKPDRARPARAAEPDDEIIVEGGRHNALLSRAGAMRRVGMGESAILAALRVTNGERCKPPLPDEEIQELARDVAARYEPATKPTITGARTATPADDERTHTWQPVDLVEAALEPPEPPTIGGIVYPGRRHLFSGEPEASKSWTALVLCVLEIRAGRTVLYVDFEMGKREMYDRLRALGLTNDEIRTRFIYLEPSEPYEPVTIGSDVASLLAAQHPSLVIIDAFTGALQMQGLNPDKGVEIEQFYRTVLAPLRAHGAATAVLDHLAKSKDGRGQFAIGSERKVGGCDVHLGFEQVSPFSRGRRGITRILTKKDRPGFLPRPKVAEVELASDPATGRIEWTIRYAGEGTDDQPRPFRPTVLMERVSRYVEASAEPPSRTRTEEQVPGKVAALRTAIDTLIDEGFLVAEDGPRRAKLLRSEVPYREENDGQKHL